MIVGEAPGEEEIKARSPFVGKAGREMNNYLDRVGISRDRCFVTNTIRCRPTGNANPTRDQIRACAPLLMADLLRIRPRLVITAGRFATQWFLGDVDMEQVHGLAFRVDAVHYDKERTLLPFPVTVVPVYHPAAGLHDTVWMSTIMGDFMAARRVLNGEQSPAEFDPVAGDYGLWPGGPVPRGPIVAMDTETAEDWKPWCVQWCKDPGEAWMAMADDKDTLAQLAEWVSDPGTLVVMHNALFDLPILAKMGIRPARCVDTMIMAYLLQTEPQALKVLAYRHLGMLMKTYDEMVALPTQLKALGYLMEAEERDWPDPAPVLEWAKGVPRVRQPHNIKRRIRAIMRDYEKEGTDLYSRWRKIDRDEGRGMVEDEFGVLYPGLLKDVPLAEAVEYACRDADATLRLYPILSQKIEEMKLDGPLARDMRMLPLVAAMGESGIQLDLDYFTALSAEFARRMEDIEDKIMALGFGRINPGSAPQVADLLYRLKLSKHSKSMKGGTDRRALEALASKHPVIPLIMEWRGYDKLQDSYLGALPKKVSPDGRIRTTLRVTRVVTGRLSSSNPNLMAQPVRTEEGRKIRGGFVARPGYQMASFDYSQIEMRVVAHISQDPVMISVFREGRDIHSATAAAIFRLPETKLDEMKHRYPAKRVGFGILNLISPEKLLQELVLGGAGDWTVQGCQELILNWFGVYRGVRAWIEEQKAHARRFGYVRDMWGRIRLVPEMLSVHRNIVEAGIRQACNAPIQMGAQGVIKEAMGQLVPVVEAFGDGAVPLIQIHDDLVFELREDLVHVAVPLILSIMENAVDMSVPIKVDCKVGPRWNEMTKWRSQ